jgi:hypothetical protein
VVAKDLLHKFQLPIAPCAYEQPLEWEEFKIKIPQSFARRFCPQISVMNVKITTCHAMP